MSRAYITHNIKAVQTILVTIRFTSIFLKLFGQSTAGIASCFINRWFSLGNKKILVKHYKDFLLVCKEEPY